MKSFVYLNNKKRMFSVKCIDKISIGYYNKVFSYEHYIYFQYPVEFYVNVKIRERVRNNGRKEIHAGIVGNYEPRMNHYEEIEKLDLDEYSLAYYNPYEVDQFVDMHTREPLESASKLIMISPNKMYYK